MLHLAGAILLEDRVVQAVVERTAALPDREIHLINRHHKVTTEEQDQQAHLIMVAVVVVVLI